MSTPAVLSPDLVVALKRLRLGRIADTLPERLVLADKQEMTFDDLLLLVLTDEIERRDNTAAESRASTARLDPAMRLECWDKTSKVAFDKRMLAELTSLRFLEAHRHVVVLGPVSVGKTFVSQAVAEIGHLQQGRSTVPLAASSCKTGGGMTLQTGTFTRLWHSEVLPPLLRSERASACVVSLAWNEGRVRGCFDVSSLFAVMS